MTKFETKSSTKLAPTVTHYLTYLDTLNRSTRTRAWYRQKLEVLLPLLAEAGATDADSLTMRVIREAIGAVQRRGVSARTVCGYVQVLKSWVHYLGEEEELVSPVLYKRIQLPKVPQRLIKAPDDETIAALFAATKWHRAPWMTARDQAILHVLLDTGVRASELCGLTMRGLRLDTPSDPHLIVIGKGDKERGVGPLSYATIRSLRRYLRVRRETSCDRVFVNRLGQPLTIYGLDRLLYRLRDQAGLAGEAEVRAHVFRHRFALDKLRAGWDIKRISLLLGHASVTTTEVYLRDFQQAEARHLPPPPHK